MPMSVKKMKALESKIKKLSDEVMEAYSSATDSEDLKECGFTLYKASISIGNQIKKDIDRKSLRAKEELDRQERTV